MVNKANLLVTIAMLSFIMIDGLAGQQIQWENTYGGSGNDWVSCIIETSDGAYLIAGGTYSFGAGDKDIYLVKVDKNGNKIWQKTYGGSEEDWAYVIETSDGAYLMAGFTYSFGDSGDVYLVKVDKDGNKIWEKTYGGNDIDEAWFVIETSDGAYLIAGRTESFGAGGDDVYLIKVDKNGNEIWEKTYGGDCTDWAFSVIETSDGAYLMAGYTKSFGAGGRDVYLVTVDKDGNKIWEKTYGGSDDEVAFSVIETSDGAYLIAGFTESFGAGG